jgi:hypothetical protein
MIDEFKDLEESGRGVIKVLYWHLPGGTEKSQEETPVKVASVLAEIQTQHLFG